MKKWTEEDIETLRTLYPTTPSHEVARRLGRTTAAITTRAGNDGLVKSYARKAATEDNGHVEGASVGPDPAATWARLLADFVRANASDDDAPAVGRLVIRAARDGDPHATRFLAAHALAAMADDRGTEAGR